MILIACLCRLKIGCLFLCIPQKAIPDVIYGNNSELEIICHCLFVQLKKIIKLWISRQQIDNIFSRAIQQKILSFAIVKMGFLQIACFVV